MMWGGFPCLCCRPGTGKNLVTVHCSTKCKTPALFTTSASQNYNRQSKRAGAGGGGVGGGGCEEGAEGLFIMEICMKFELKRENLILKTRYSTFYCFGFICNWVSLLSAATA